MRRLVVTAAARRDLAEIVEYVGRSSGSVVVARRLGALLTERCRRLAGLPGTLGTGRPELGSGVRIMVQGNHLVLFRYEPGRLQVLRFFEGHRDVGAGMNEG